MNWPFGAWIRPFFKPGPRVNRSHNGTLYTSFLSRWRYDSTTTAVVLCLLTCTSFARMQKFCALVPRLLLCDGIFTRFVCTQIFWRFSVFLKTILVSSPCGHGLRVSDEYVQQLPSMTQSFDKLPLATEVVLCRIMWQTSQLKLQCVTVTQIFLPCACRWQPPASGFILLVQLG